jgi:cell filamentation protein
VIAVSEAIDATKAIAENTRISASVKASLVFEGLTPSAGADEVGAEYLEGKITSTEAMARITARYAPSFKNNKSSDFAEYDHKDTKQSIYCYPGTNVLKNKAGIVDADALADFEADVSMLRLFELETNQAVKGKFGATHLKRIHQHIFQDIYPFAGRYRFEDISKGSTLFCKSEFIDENLIRLLQELAKDKYLTNLTKEQYAGRAAYYLVEINMIHPFREGNGRTTREFIRQLAFHSGYVINWSLIHKDALFNATIAAVNKDYSPLSACILKACENVLI